MNQRLVVILSVSVAVVVAAIAAIVVSANRADKKAAAENERGRLAAEKKAEKKGSGIGDQELGQEKAEK